MDLTPIPTGNDVRVNTFTASNQIQPAVTALASGGFVVTWQSEGQDGDGLGIYGQRYAADGTPLGSEFRVNTYTTSDQRFPVVAGLADGGFVVTWWSSFQDGSSTGIYGQRYAADGTAAGSEFRVNTYTNLNQDGACVAALPGGGFVVTWGSNFQDGTPLDIYGQRYAADGTPLGGEFKVNTYSNDVESYSSVAALPGGGFVVTWSSFGQDGNGYGIYGQRYSADGAAAWGASSASTRSPLIGRSTPP